MLVYYFANIVWYRATTVVGCYASFAMQRIDSSRSRVSHDECIPLYTSALRLHTGCPKKI